MNLPRAADRLRILTWHIHGSYLYYLAQCPHEFFLPVKEGRPEGYTGRTSSHAWPENIHEVPAEEIQDLNLDCVLFQSRKNYLQDQYELLSPAQQRLPRLYLEHDPPSEHPTDTPHPVDDPNILLIHVTNFNNLMWDNGRTPTRVIEPGVLIPEGIKYTGELERGLVIVDHLFSGGRRSGLDLFERARGQIPLDLAGINSRELGGLGDLSHRELLELAGHYRFMFHPMRYSSLALTVCEAMMIGMPVVGMATTEMVTAIENGSSGYINTDLNQLIVHMQRLLVDTEEAQILGRAARRVAQKRFNIQRFTSDWEAAFASVIGLPAISTSRVIQEAPL